MLAGRISGSGWSESTRKNSFWNQFYKSDASMAFCSPRKWLISLEYFWNKITVSWYKHIRINLLSFVWIMCQPDVVDRSWEVSFVSTWNQIYVKCSLEASRRLENRNVGAIFDRFLGAHKPSERQKFQRDVAFDCKEGLYQAVSLFQCAFSFRIVSLGSLVSFRHDVQDKPIKTVFERPKVKLQWRTSSRFGMLWL